MAGLSPEEINRAVATNVAGSKLLQDSVQNIFENNQKQAYTDYLDRLPQDKLQVDRWEHIPGGDGFYWIKDKNTGEIKKTDIPVAKRVLEHSPGGTAGMAPKVVQGFDANGNPVYGFADPRTKTITQPSNQPGAAPPVTPGKLPTEAAKLSEAEAKELEMTDAILRGTYKDKNRNTVKFNQEHATRYNQLSTQPEAVFVKKVPGKIYGTNEEVVRKPIPGNLPVREAYKQFQFFTREGGRGSFEDFIANPDIMAQVAAAMRK